MASRGSHHCRIHAGGFKGVSLREPRAGFNSRPLLFSDRESLDGVGGVKCQQHHYGVHVLPRSHAPKQAQTRVKTLLTIKQLFVHGRCATAARRARCCVGCLPLQRYKRPVLRRCVSNNGTRSAVGTRSFGYEGPSVFTPAVGSGWRTLAAGGSLEDLIGYCGPQSRWLCSWLSEKIVRVDGAKIE